MQQAPKENQEKSSKQDYESSFDDLLKEGEVSKEQEQEFQKRREEKA